MGQCNASLGTYDDCSQSSECIYFTFFKWFNKAQFFVTLLGVSYLYLRSGRPFYVTMVCILITFATLFASCYAETCYLYVINECIMVSTEDYKSLSLPFRDLAVVLGSIAHWIFTV